MSDLIERQDAVDAIFGRSHDIIKARLKNLPSAQPEIIRCKDCKLYGDAKCLMNFDGNDWAEPEGYCHAAERRAKNGRLNRQTAGH